jgi:predicted transcriptional regulator
MLYSKRQYSDSERACMRRSKLELYEDILKALVNKALTVDSIAYACNMDCVALRQRLNFLMQSGLVEERIYAKKTRFALTQRGLAIFKTLVLTKSLEKLQTNMKKIDEALQAIPSLTEYTAKHKKRNENY